MRLFGKKKSSNAIQEEQPPPAISRPRAQGHLPPTTAPKPSSRRSYGSTHTTEQVITPLYARFARADSFENLSLRAKAGAESRAPSMAPTNQELEDDANRLGYDRPWARELATSFDSPEPIQPANTGSSVRIVSGSSVRDRKTSVDKRLSLEAVAAADPFMASKMQSVMRRAPSNVRTPDSTPQRSVTAPPTTAKPSHPPPRIPTAPPTRSVTGPKSPPSSRPSFDDDDTSVFSHSNAGHAQPRSVYSNIASASSKRERGPPPVAGTPSAYAWRSGQSDDGHGGGNSFYTGGSQVNPYTWAQPGSSAPQPVSVPAAQSFLPPGAAPPNPSGQPNPNHAPPSSMSMGNVLKKRTPSNPPVNRTPAPAGHPASRRMSVSSADVRPLSGGPGTWGGSAIAVPQTTERERERDRERGRGGMAGSTSTQAGTSTSAVPPSSTVAGPSSTAARPNPTAASQPTAHVPNQTYGDLSRTPTVKSVQPGEIFRHPGTAPMPLPSSHSAPYQAVSPAVSPPPLLPSKSAASGSSTPTAPSAMSPPRLVTSPRQVISPPPSQPTSQVNTAASQPPQVPVSAPPPPPKKSTGNLPPGASPSSPSPTTPYKHSPSSHGPSYSAYGPTPGSAYGSVGANGSLNEHRTSASTQESKNASGQLQEPKAGGVNAYESSVSSIRKVSQLPAVQPSDPRTNQVSDVRKGQVSDVRDRRASQFPDPRPSYSSEARPSYSSDARTSQHTEGRASPIKPSVGNQLTTSPVGVSDSTWARSIVADAGSGRATPVSPQGAGLSVPGPDARSSVYSGASSVSVVPPSTPLPSPSPSKSKSAASKTAPPNRELPQPPTTTTTTNRPGPSPHPPSSLRETSQSIPPRAPSSMSVSSYGTAMPLESDPGFEVQPAPTKLAIGGLAPINTSAPRSQSPTPTSTSVSAAPTSAMVTARMTPTTTAALSPMTIPSIPSSTPQRGLLPPRAVSPTFTGQRAPSPTGANRRAVSPTPSNRRAVSPAPGNRRAVSPAPADRRAVSPAPTTRSESDESVHAKKRNLLVKTRKIDGASSFRSSDERASSERPVSVVAQPESPGPGLGLSGGNDPFARAPPTIVKTPKRTQDQPSKRTMPLSPPLSSDDHDTRVPNGLDVHGYDRPPMTPALTDEAPAGDEMNQAEPDTTTPPGSPPPPKIYPLETHLNMPSLIAALLPHLSFRDWNALNALNAGIRRQLEDTRALREEVLEYWLRGVGYARWKSHKREPIGLTLRDLNAYMRGVSIAVYRYSAIAESFLAVRAQQEQTKERVPGAASKGNLVRALASSCRAYTKVILRLREQAECMHPDGDFRSPLFKSGGAPLLRVFVPSKEGAWLSDASVLDCEKELKRAGALGVLRIGDVIWDAAVGDEGNAGRMVWDGNYLVDLDYTYSTTGELPKYIHSLAFSPSYWHKIIRTSNSPLCHIDLTPYAAEIARNIQLVQDRVQTETPQGGRHTVVRWVHRSRFQTRSGLPIPSASPPATVDRMWDGYIVVEVEGTNEGLADLQARVGNSVRLFPAKTAGMEFGPPTGKSPFRLLRSSSRPGEIWIRAVREKERLLKIYLLHNTPRTQPPCAVLSSMMEKLSVASNRLRDALDEYLAVCGGIERAVEEDPTGALIDPTDYISCELDMVNSYAETIDKAKAKIKRVRNWSSAIAINRLPIEILMQIFEWAVRSEHCANSYRQSHSPIELYPKQPELLSHVCSRWRNILLSSPQFWTHIDFNFWAADYQRLYDRAERHLARAGEHPVRVHHIFSISRGIEVIPRPINPFIAAASQAYAIEAEIQVDLEFAPGQLYDSLLHACFHGCVPGKLNEVFVSLRPTGSRTFAYIDEHHIFNPTSNEENIFSSVTSLWMDGLYLPWTSSAYRGLVKLVLLRFSTISIPESELITILSGCPGLQKLHLDINIIENEPLSNSHGATSVYLYDLHDLCVESPNLFRLVVPGVKALKITILNSWKFPLKSNHVREFFANSNVETVNLVVWKSYSELFDVLELAPRAACVMMSNSPGSVELKSGEIPSLNQSLSHLVLVHNEGLRLEDIQKLSEALGIQRVTLSSNGTIV
ncbi:hypothetical protein RHS04_00176 [Rhizoctonia solani]|uniref:F-box domain-containing protein n=1 Tax=Rhizoctonia solani TaxID=456999 RepID=A0A8H7HJU3_9AGAM|nr:hypothetical protein RHS04_00176 [Rhizoctonia solani]